MPGWHARAPSFEQAASAVIETTRAIWKRIFFMDVSLSDGFLRQNSCCYLEGTFLPKPSMRFCELRSPAAKDDPSCCDLASRSQARQTHVDSCILDVAFAAQASDRTARRPDCVRVASMIADADVSPSPARRFRRSRLGCVGCVRPRNSRGAARPVPLLPLDGATVPASTRPGQRVQPLPRAPLSRG